MCFNFVKKNSFKNLTQDIHEKSLKIKKSFTFYFGAHKRLLFSI